MVTPEPPKSSIIHDLIVATGKGVISSIPLVGNVLSEYAGVLSDTLKRRAEQWENRVTEALSAIEARFARLPDELFRDEGFVTALQLASVIAMREGRREKLDLLKNALISAASGRYKAFEQEQLVRKLESLSQEHIQVLGWLTEAHGLSQYQSLDDVFQAFVEAVPTADRQVFRTIIHDLSGQFLIVTADISDYDEYETKRVFRVTESTSIQPMAVTPLGRALIEFVYAA